MNIIIIGGNGFVGRNIQEILSAAPDINTVTSVSRENEFNLLNEKQNSKHERILQQADYIINCAAVTDVDLCENNRSLAYNVNVCGMKNILSSNLGDCKILHISTDYIFDGKKNLYYEDDLPHPKSYYGKTKLICENLIKKNSLNKTFNTLFSELTITTQDLKTQKTTNLSLINKTKILQDSINLYKKIY